MKIIINLKHSLRLHEVCVIWKPCDFHTNLSKLNGHREFVWKKSYEIIRKPVSWNKFNAASSRDKHDRMQWP
jgi:hypothetical protein